MDDLMSCSPVQNDRADELFTCRPRGTIAIDCRTGGNGHYPLNSCIRDYKEMLKNLNDKAFPCRGDKLPGQDKIKKILKNTISEFE